MATESDKVIANAARLLSDQTNTLWSAGTLIGWLNEAQHRIAVDVPSSNTVAGDVDLVAGARQSLPTGGIQALSCDTLRKVDKAAFDRENAAWQSATPSDTGSMWLQSNTNPRTFFVYPPRVGAGVLPMEYSVLPAEVTLGDDITMPDQYSDAITDYIVARALSEDSDMAEPGRADSFMASFKMKAGING